MMIIIIKKIYDSNTYMNNMQTSLVNIKRQHDDNNKCKNTQSKHHHEPHTKHNTKHNHTDNDNK